MFWKNRIREEQKVITRIERRYWVVDHNGKEKLCHDLVFAEHLAKAYEELSEFFPCTGYPPPEEETTMLCTGCPDKPRVY